MITITNTGKEEEVTLDHIPYEAFKYALDSTITPFPHVIPYEFGNRVAYYAECNRIQDLLIDNVGAQVGHVSASSPGVFKYAGGEEDWDRVWAIYCTIISDKCDCPTYKKTLSITFGQGWYIVKDINWDGSFVASFKCFVCLEDASDAVIVKLTV